MPAIDRLGAGALPCGDEGWGREITLAQPICFSPLSIRSAHSRCQGSISSADITTRFFFFLVLRLLRHQLPVSRLVARCGRSDKACSTFAERMKKKKGGGTIAAYRRFCYQLQRYSLLYIKPDYEIVCVHCMLDGAGARKQESKEDDRGI